MSSSSESLACCQKFYNDCRDLQYRCAQKEERMTTRIAKADKKIRAQWEEINSLEDQKMKLVIRSQSVNELTNTKVLRTVEGFSAFNTMKIYQSEIDQMEKKSAMLDEAISAARSEFNHKRKTLPEAQQYRSIMTKEVERANLMGEKTRRTLEAVTNITRKTKQLEEQILILLQTQQTVHETQYTLAGITASINKLIRNINTKYSALSETTGDSSAASEQVDEIAIQLQKVRQNTLNQTKLFQHLKTCASDIKSCLENAELAKKSIKHVQYKNRIFGDENNLSLKDKIVLCEIILSRLFYEASAKSMKDVAIKFKDLIRDNLSLFVDYLDLRNAVELSEEEMWKRKEGVKNIPKEMEVEVQQKASQISNIESTTNNHRQYSQALERQSDEMGEELEHAKTIVLKLCEMIKHGRKSSHLISDEDLMHCLCALKRNIKSMFAQNKAPRNEEERMKR